MPSSFNRKKERVCVYLNLLDRLCVVCFFISFRCIPLRNLNIETLTFWSFSVNLSQNSSLSNSHLLINLSWKHYWCPTPLLCTWLMSFLFHFVCLSLIDGDGVLDGSAAAGSWLTVTDLQPYTNYSFWIRGCNTQGCVNSLQVNVTTPPAGNSNPWTTTVKTIKSETNVQQRSWGHLRQLLLWQSYFDLHLYTRPGEIKMESERMFSDGTGCEDMLLQGNKHLSGPQW